MIRAVIDTNVLVSALISPSGNEALIVLAVSQGLLTACVSREILQEYAEVLARPKFSFRQDEIGSLLQLLNSNGENTVPEPLSLTLPDPEDRKFLACAKTASADFIVTGNKRHFPQNICGEVEVLNASELLDRMTFDASW